MLIALGRRPSLWPTAVKQLGAIVAPGWATRPPFLPLPDPHYLRFRMVTAYGGTGTTVFAAHEVITYLEWCRAWPHVTGSD